MAEAKRTTAAARIPRTGPRRMEDWEREDARRGDLGKLRMLRAIGEENLYAGLCFDDIFGQGKREMAKRWHMPRLVVEFAFDFGISEGLRPNDITEFQAWMERHEITFDEVREVFSPDDGDEADEHDEAQPAAANG